MDPAWIGLAGAGWTGQGHLRADLRLSADLAPGRWELHPQGVLEGRVDRVVCPLLAAPIDSLTARLAGEDGTISGHLEGIWGGSPFRLRLRSFPDPGTGFPYRDTGQWEFRSPQARLESFGASHPGGAGLSLPVWLGLPGHGEFRITRGSAAGVRFSDLFGAGRRGPAGPMLDTLDVRLAGGVLRVGSPREVPSDRTGPGSPWRATNTPSTREWRQTIRGEDLDLAELLRGAGGLGIALPGKFEGTVSFTAERSSGRGPGEADLRGRIEARDGEISGVPLQDNLSLWSGLAGLANLPFHSIEALFRYGPSGIAWKDLSIDAPLGRLAGTGRWDERSGVDAVVAATMSVGGSGGVGRLLQGVLGGNDATLYLLVQGPLETPSVRLIPLGTFRSETERLDAAPGAP